MEFRARKFTGDATGAIDLVGARELTRDEVNAACPRYEEVQRRLDAIVDAVRSDNPLLSGANFGTRVHARLEAEIKTLADPNLKSEVSVLKGEEVRRGRPGCKRIDVYERPQAAIVCAHDIKTEKAISHRGADS
ncbi:MAG: hypothetical protein ABWZ80_02540 [Beijerinckiaceae bacterium]